MNSAPAKKRGRPKGAVSTSLAEVRRQAAEEQRQLRSVYEKRIAHLQQELNELQLLHVTEVTRLNEELELMKRREINYQQALGQRLTEVVCHLQDTLINWGKAELEEAQIDKRKRGRPRKTIKAK